MTATPPWQLLVEALDNELVLLARLRELALEGHGPLVRLDIAAVEDWTRRQQELLAVLARAAEERTRRQDACLPRATRGLAGPGVLGDAVTLHALVAAAPPSFADRLRQQRDTLRRLRDEVALVSRRNEMLIRQVLDFTSHLGEGLAERTTQRGYGQDGRTAESRSSGELFNRSL